jgi:hypothetical protein
VDFSRVWSKYLFFFSGREVGYTCTSPGFGVNICFSFLDGKWVMHSEEPGDPMCVGKETNL